MESIPFEKVSVEEARQALEKNGAGADSPRAPASTSERVGAEAISTLAPAAVTWIENLPDRVRPTALGNQFPRIVNRLTQLWPRPLQCEKYLDALLLDERGNREGFPPTVVSELIALKDHLVTHIMERHFNSWGDRLGD